MANSRLSRTPQTPAQTPAPASPRIVGSCQANPAAWLTNGMSFKKLEDGKHDGVLLDSIKFISEVAEGKKPYFRVDLKLGDRVLTDTRTPQGMDILVAQIKAQLGIEDQDVPVPTLIETLKTTEFSIWTSHVDVNGTSRRNINYREPLPEETQEPAVGAVEDGTGLAI